MCTIINSHCYDLLLIRRPNANFSGVVFKAVSSRRKYAEKIDHYQRKHQQNRRQLDKLALHKHADICGTDMHAVTMATDNVKVGLF